MWGRLGWAWLLHSGRQPTAGPQEVLLETRTKVVQKSLSPSAFTWKLRLALGIFMSAPCWPPLAKPSASGPQWRGLVSGCQKMMSSGSAFQVLLGLWSFSTYLRTIGLLEQQPYHLLHNPGRRPLGSDGWRNGWLNHSRPAPKGFR